MDGIALGSSEEQSHDETKFRYMIKRLAAQQS